jgi:hypothetical protein
MVFTVITVSETIKIFRKLNMAAKAAQENCQVTSNNCRHKSGKSKHFVYVDPCLSLNSNTDG